MREIEIPLAVDFSDEQVERAITRAIGDCELRITLFATLGKFPGCVHWHLKRGDERGTLEITFGKSGGVRGSVFIVDELASGSTTR